MAPYKEMKFRTLTIERDDVVPQARHGDILCVMKSVGDANQMFLVKDFKMTIIHKKPFIATVDYRSGHQIDEL